MENNIEKEIKNLTARLLEIVNLYCWNAVSENLMFILSDISEVKGKDFFIQRSIKNKLNKNKIPKSLKEAINELKEIYDLIYDINLYVYKAEKHQTIIDIRYFLKKNLDPDFSKTIADAPPMLHSKIEKPPYLKNNKTKFDVNWELGGMKYNWNMFWWKANYTYKNSSFFSQSNK